MPEENMAKECFAETFWAEEYAKRGKNTYLRNLVVAGALIAAEIDRLQALKGENHAPGPEAQ
jgi:hypothetical protein